MLRNVFLAILFLAIATALIFLAFSYRMKGCSLTYRLNPDLTCQIRDEKGERVLVEYFNLDTNELRLYLQQDGKDVLIEHPYGLMNNYSSNVNANDIKIDRSDERYLLVNGERFEIRIKP